MLFLRQFSSPATCVQSSLLYRNGVEAVPGCEGTGQSGYDYCIDRPTANTLIVNGDNGVPAEHFPLGFCEGDCVSLSFSEYGIFGMICCCSHNYFLLCNNRTTMAIVHLASSVNSVLQMNPFLAASARRSLVMTTVDTLMRINFTSRSPLEVGSLQPPWLHAAETATTMISVKET